MEWQAIELRPMTDKRNNRYIPTGDRQRPPGVAQVGILRGGQRRHFRVGNDLHIQMGDRPADVDAARESCRIDAAADREWFRLHSRETRRERRASVRELRAHSLLIGTVVVVLLGPFGEQVRMFFPPVEVN